MASNPGDNPYDEPKEETKQRARSSRSKERAKSIFSLKDTPTVELPDLSAKLTIGTAGVGKVVSKVRPISGYVIIHESKDIGKNLDKALHELATKNPIIRKAVLWFSAVGEGASFLEPFSYVAVAVYMEQTMRRNPSDPMIVKCFEYLKNNGIDLEKEGLLEVEQPEEPVNVEGLAARQQTQLERLLEQQQQGSA